jgi:hypothetical protein
MIVIRPTKLRNERKKYLEIAVKEPAIVKERLITDQDIKNGLTREELMRGVREDIKEIYSRKK